jgi:hypothetical protein
MPSEILTSTAKIIMSHASMTELTPKELVGEIKQVYNVLASLEREMIAPTTKAPVAKSRQPRKVKMAESPEAKAVENEDGKVIGDPDYMEFMASREG